MRTSRVLGNHQHLLINGIDTIPVVTAGELRRGKVKREQVTAGPVTTGYVHSSQGGWWRRDSRVAPLGLPYRHCQRLLHFH